MAASFLHGVETIDIKQGVRPVKETRSAVIGLVGTAPKGAVNKLTLCLSSADDAQFGDITANHTIPSALKTLREQGAGAVMVVNVGDETTGIGQTITASDIIGRTNTDGGTGIQLFALGYGTYGFDARILIAPYFSDNPAVGSALDVMAHKIKAVAYCDLPQGLTPTEAVASRGNVVSNNKPVLQTQSTRVRLCYPWRVIFDPLTNKTKLEPSSIAWAGVRARVDREIGYWTSSSNKEMRGTLGLERTLTARIDDADTEVNLLNEAGISTIFKSFGTGFLSWGNRTAAFPTITAYENFEQVQRTKDMIEVALHQSSLQFVDSDIRQPQIESITEFCHEYMRSLVMRGAIVGGQAYFDPTRNPQVDIANGQLRFGYKFTPIFPLERITYEREVTGEYLLDLRAVGLGF